jgi:sulfur-carrier protein
MPTVIVPPPYRGPTRGEDRVGVEGETVRDCLEAVEQAHPGFLSQVLTPDGRVHRFVRLFRNGKALEGESLGVRVAADDELEIVAAIAGG